MNIKLNDDAVKYVLQISKELNLKPEQIVDKALIIAAAIDHFKPEQRVIFELFLDDVHAMAVQLKNEH